MKKRILALIGLIGLGSLLFWGGTVFAQATGMVPGFGWQSGQMMTFANGPAATMPHMTNGNRMSGYAGNMANHMMGQGMMMSTTAMGGQMMGTMGTALGAPSTTDPTGSAVDEAPVFTAAEAIEIAQAYLDSNQPGSQAETHADAFPGYYTLHTLQDGAVDGMLSVNAFTGAVFSHHWHGDFVEMSDLDHD